MKKRILSVFLAVVLLVTVVAALSCQKAPTLEEKRAALIETLSDGKYDYDYNLVDLVGTQPIGLANYQRAVLVEGFIKSDKGEQQISASLGLAWIYDKEYVAVPIQLFYAMNPIFGMIPIWQVPGIILKAYLLPDLRVDDEWQKEELGRINFNEKLGFAVIQRVDPVINAAADYNVGKYQELSVGNALYVTSQANGRITVERSEVLEILTHVKDVNLFGAPGELMFNELGGIAFALRDGKPEVIGFLGAMEPVEGEPDMVYVYYIDVQQIIDFIKTLPKK